MSARHPLAPCSAAFRSFRIDWTRGPLVIGGGISLGFSPAKALSLVSSVELTRIGQDQRGVPRNGPPLRAPGRRRLA